MNDGHVLITGQVNGKPRMMISMNIYDGTFQCGYNYHYRLDVPIHECLAHFFSRIPIENPGYWIDLKKSKLKIEFLDLPTEKSVDLLVTQ